MTKKTPNGKLHKAITNSIINLRKEFRKNHKLKVNLKSKIRYGRSISLSNFFERTFALELSKHYPSLHFLIDYPISIYNNKYLGTLYYDILIVKSTKKSKILEEGEIIGIIDLKIDLGYINESYYGFPENWKNANKIKIKQNYLFKDRETKFETATKISCSKIVNNSIDIKRNETDKITLTKSSNINKISIVATKNNDHDRSCHFEQMMKENGYSVLFILEKLHPNSNTILDFKSTILTEMQNKAGKLAVINFTT